MAAVESIVSQTSSSVEWAPVRYVRGYHPAHTKPYSEIALGSTAHIWRHELPPGVIIKAPHSHEDLLDLSLQNKYCTEAAILQSLGSHSRTVKYCPASQRILGQCSSCQILGASQSTIATQGLAPRRGSQWRRVDLPDYTRCYN